NNGRQFLLHYAIGAVLANFYVTKQHATIFHDHKKLSAIVLFVSITVLFATEFFVGSVYSFTNDVQVFPSLVFAVEFGAIIYLTLISPAMSVIRCIFTNRFAQFTGKLGYSVYAIHLPILDAVSMLRLPLIGWIGASYALIFLVSTTMHYAVERPFLRLRGIVLQKMRGRRADQAQKIAVISEQ
ncbi:MAG: hypothetical protein M1587_00435, partial [Thaumarchaeota archaeon]|nr:hypothetical protein [Nitrososphaerota archaeon]